jgi:hypothetical protein
MSKKYKWLGREIQALGPYLCLCLNQKDYEQALYDLSIKTSEPYLSGNRLATVHFFENNESRAAIVCMNETNDIMENISTLVHESVHVWQQYAETIHETNPGSEQEAYAIEHISFYLIEEYLKRKKIKIK